MSTIESLFRNIKVDNYGIEEESTLVKRRPNYSKGDALVSNNDKSGFEEVKTLGSDVPTTLDYKHVNYDSYSLTKRISLHQSMINSSNAYEQNKDFTKHIV